MIIAVPVTPDGQVDPRWGRAARVAVARVDEGRIVAWDEGGHHARVARFVVDQGITTVVANHMGPPMVQMLGRMGIEVRLGAAGSARLVVTGAG
jgi:predicted Fe-Mo cluster-binding NifX family protein